MTFVQATFVLGTFVHIRSEISELSLTQFWWNFKGNILGTSQTDSNYQVDICPGNICPADICPYQEYLSCHWPNFDETWKVDSKKEFWLKIVACYLLYNAFFLMLSTLFFFIRTLCFCWGSSFLKFLSFEPDFFLFFFLISRVLRLKFLIFFLSFWCSEAAFFKNFQVFYRNMYLGTQY